MRDEQLVVIRADANQSMKTHFCLHAWHGGLHPAWTCTFEHLRRLCLGSKQRGALVTSMVDTGHAALGHLRGLLYDGYLVLQVRQGDTPDGSCPLAMRRPAGRFLVRSRSAGKKQFLCCMTCTPRVRQHTWCLPKETGSPKLASSVFCRCASSSAVSSADSSASIAAASFAVPLQPRRDHHARRCPW